MHYQYRNVNDAFVGLVQAIHTGALPTVVTPSRAGEVMMVPHPVLVSYTHPLERVLLHTGRDANPFFHLFESLWMLAGCNTVAPLAYYNSRIGDIASDDGKTFNGAYGYRWRHPVDQLDIIVQHLRANPGSRRAVLQMWNTQDDLLRVDDTKDVCCNTHVYFSVEQGMCPDCNGTGYNNVWGLGTQGPEPCTQCHGLPHNQPAYLNMTVCNRSNDLLWGLLGANVVHFSVLQEYIALSLGLQVGTYYQFTNNLHVYTDRWTPDKWSTSEQPKGQAPYAPPQANRIPLVEQPDRFDAECKQFVDGPLVPPTSVREKRFNWKEPFLQHVAAPMCWAYRLHKQREYALALKTVDEVWDYNWRTAATNWIQQRQARYMGTSS